MKLLSRNATNAKLAKSAKRHEGTNLSLESGASVCPYAEALKLACRKPGACIDYAGMGAFSNVRQARETKTRQFLKEREAFLTTLKWELGLQAKRAKRNGKRAVCRLNTFSDIAWEQFGVPQDFGSITFYDYTKSAKRAFQYGEALDAYSLGSGEGGVPSWPSNYHLTYSFHEKTLHADLVSLLTLGVSVALPIAGPLPDKLLVPEIGLVTVIDGDESDDRFADPLGAIVGLKAKGSVAKRGELAEWIRPRESGSELRGI